MERGQAAIEYVGAVALVALALMGAAAVAAPELPRTVAHHVRVGLCIVAGDVCRASDARRAGLDPCVLRVREGDSRVGGSIAVVRVGDRQAFAIERRSDGMARLMVARGSELGAAIGVGIKLGAHAQAGADSSASVGWTSGDVWEFPSEAALLRALRGARHRPREIDEAVMRVRGSLEPAERFHAATGTLGAAAGARIVGLDAPLAGGGLRGAIGRRTRRGRTSWYFDAGQEGPHLFGGLIPEIELGGGAWVIELIDAPRELRVTSSLPDGVEIDARLDLTRPANAAVARALLARPSRSRARALGRHMAVHGTVERRRYRVRDLPAGRNVGVNLGIAGVELSSRVQERTLVSAEVLRPEGRARRADCLGL